MILFLIYHSANAKAHCAGLFSYWPRNSVEDHTSRHIVSEVTLLHGENATCLHIFKMLESILAEVRRNSSVDMNITCTILLLSETQRKKQERDEKRERDEKKERDEISVGSYNNQLRPTA